MLAKQRFLITSLLNSQNVFSSVIRGDMKTIILAVNYMGMKVSSDMRNYLPFSSEPGRLSKENFTLDH